MENWTLDFGGNNSASISLHVALPQHLVSFYSQLLLLLLCTVIALRVIDGLTSCCRNFEALMERFTHHLVKTSPATESGSYSGIAADKVSQ